MSKLSRTEKSLVAIARALAVDCDFLVLDEPTASLPADEVERLFNVLRRLREKGVGMIYVSHRLDEIFQIADRVAVLRDGRMAGVREVADTSSNELVSLIVGGETREINISQVQKTSMALRVCDLQAHQVGPVSFDLFRGEMLGLVGLRGAGHETIGRALVGAEEFQGKIELDGETPDLSSLQNAVKSGVGFVARDRVVESIAPGLSIRENLFINPLIHARKALSLKRHREEAEATSEIGKGLGLHPNDPGLAIEALSGGNQQKVIMGRWSNTNRKLLIAEDPTAGVDVGAKVEIYDLLFKAMEAGMAVLIISTDFEEIAAICHRALVFANGQIISEIDRQNLSTSTLIKAASAGEVLEKEFADELS